MLKYLIIFLLIYSLTVCQEDVSEFERTKEAMERYLKLDKSDWTDFGDMFNYDPLTATNVRKSTKDEVMDESFVNNICFKSIKQAENCRLELSDVKKQNKCDKLMMIIMQRVGRKIQNKLHDLASRFQTSSSNYNLVITFDSLNFDQLFNIDSNNCSSMDEIDTFFNDLIKNFRIINPLDYWVEKLTTYAPTLITLLTVLITLWCLFKASTRTRVLIFLTVFVIFCVTWEWFRLYKQELAEMNLNLNLRSQCHFDEGWLSAMGNYFHNMISFSKRGLNKCEKYYQAVYIDPILSVSPATAFSEAGAKFVLQPLGLVGQSIGLFFKNLFVHIPELYFLPVLVATLFIILAPVKFFFDYKAYVKSNRDSSLLESLILKRRLRALEEIKDVKNEIGRLPMTRSWSTGNLTI